MWALAGYSISQVRTGRTKKGSWLYLIEMLLLKYVMFTRPKRCLAPFPWIPFRPYGQGIPLSTCKLCNQPQSMHAWSLLAPPGHLNIPPDPRSRLDLAPNPECLQCSQKHTHSPTEVGTKHSRTKPVSRVRSRRVLSAKL